jgi:hypothetical protein
VQAVTWYGVDADDDDADASNDEDDDDDDPLVERLRADGEEYIEFWNELRDDDDDENEEEDDDDDVIIAYCWAPITHIVSLADRGSVNAIAIRADSGC